MDLVIRVFMAKGHWIDIVGVIEMSSQGARVLVGIHLMNVELKRVAAVFFPGRYPF